MATFYAFYPPSGGASSNASVGVNGVTAPTSSTEVGGINPGGNLQPLQTNASGSLITTPDPTGVQHVIVDSSALPSGASTSALQTTGNASLVSIDAKSSNISTNTGNSSASLISIDTKTSTIIANQTNGTQTTQISGTVPLPTGASTSALQTSGNASLTTIATNTAGVTVAQGSTTSGQSGQLIQGAVTTAAPTYTTAQTNPLSLTTAGALRVDASGAVAPLPTGAATAALQSSTQGSVAGGTAATSATLTAGVFNTSLPTLTTGQQASIQLDSSGRQIVTDAAVADLILTGASAQTATVNNILPAASGASATAASNYRSGSVQVVSTGTGGTFIFEGSNDNVNFQAIPVYNQNILTGTPIVAAITPIASQLVYIFPITTTFIRLRIATTITGGSIQAFTRLSPIAFVPPVLQVAQATTANLNTTATIASGTVTTVTTVGSVTAANIAIPGIIADVASAAITTTTTTAAFTPTFGSSYTIDIPVTAVSGTTPTMSVAVQESPDSGTNWYTVYTFPTITATGSYTSPVITLTGNRVRYAQTITGTTPSFTRAINRLQSSQAGMAVPTGTIFTDRSGTTSGTPSTSTQVAAANNQRRYLIIQNLSSSATIYINFTSNATAGSGSLPLLPFAAYAMESSTITTEAVNVLSTVASVPFTCKEG